MNTIKDTREYFVGMISDDGSFTLWRRDSDARSASVSPMYLYRGEESRWLVTFGDYEGPSRDWRINRTCEGLTLRDATALAKAWVSTKGF